ncbi:MAG: hypothetical protein O6928_05905 [Gammaproteobacteria bacterium]|nr:hypothetical protein [Gammaproteobacteria bacterium]
MLVFVSMMIVESLLVLLISIWTLYWVSFNEHVNQLVAVIDKQTRLIESVARFDTELTQGERYGCLRAASLSQVIEANAQTTVTAAGIRPFEVTSVVINGVYW